MPKTKNSEDGPATLTMDRAQHVRLIKRLNDLFDSGRRRVYAKAAIEAAVDAWISVPGDTFGDVEANLKLALESLAQTPRATGPVKETDEERQVRKFREFLKAAPDDQWNLVWTDMSNVIPGAKKEIRERKVK